MNDDTLTLYYYNDGLSDRERRDVEAALHSDLVLAARYAELKRQLEQWTRPDKEVAPPHMVERWHDSIDKAASREHVRRETPRHSFSFMSFAWGAAVTAALVIGIGIGVYFSGDDSITTLPGNTVAATDTPRNGVIPAAFTRGLQVHLRDTQRDISSLPVETAEDRTMLVLQIIQQNRIFERAAEHNDAQSLARVLRAFEPILLRLAADDIAPEDAEALREQLAFELKVMLTKLERDTSNSTHST